MTYGALTRKLCRMGARSLASSALGAAYDFAGIEAVATSQRAYASGRYGLLRERPPNPFALSFVEGREPFAWQLVLRLSTNGLARACLG